jgi:hypothetical protein
MSALSRFTRLLLLIGIMSVAVSAAPGAASADRVTATLTFADGNGVPSPIRRATVEIWRKYGWVGTWHNDFTVTTDELGRIDVTVPSVGAGAEWEVSLAPLSSGEGKAGGLVVEQGLKDRIGEAALEYAKCLASAVPTALASFDHLFGRRMPTGLGECDAV